MGREDMKIVTRGEVKMLGPQAARVLREYNWRRSFTKAECLMKNDDHGTKGVTPPIIPYVRVQRSIVYYGNIENGSYNHHSQIAKFRGKYYLAWSNGIVNEEDAGQKVLIASSDDCLTWSRAIPVLDCAPGEKTAHNCVALYSDDSRMYIAVMTEETEHDANSTGMRRIFPETSVINIYATTDGINWSGAYSFGDNVRWIFEAPRLTRDNRLMCVCKTKKHGPAVLLWPGKDICSDPEFITVPEPEGASFPYAEASWYQVDDGRILVFWRDEGASCKLYVNYSDDGGNTFSPPVLSDIPDSMSKVYVGRLEDGRYYLCNNAVASLLDRGALMLMLSNDGYRFDKVLMLNDDPVRMRRKGLLKTNGLQYPCCFVDGSRLIIAYDANKEDIMCDVIDTGKTPEVVLTLKEVL